jgi:uncharacterized protein YndB with AHSA1/START domain
MRTKNVLAEAVVVEQILDAPVARVWAALTDVRQMRQWYFDLKEFKPEIGFEFEFVVEHEGNTYHHLCKVTEVIPDKKIAYTWRYKGEPGDSLVTFELFDIGDKTRVKLTHTGIETFPKTPAYARKNFEAPLLARSLSNSSRKRGRKSRDNQIHETSNNSANRFSSRSGSIRRARVSFSARCLD